MTVSNRAKAMVVGLLILLVIILIIFFLPKRTPSFEDQTPVEIIEDQTPNKPIVETPAEPTVTPEKVAEASAQVVGKIFAERYGSYSSESELANIEDVLDICTSSYRATLERFMNDMHGASAAETYYGVSTRVLSVKTTEMNAEGTTARLELLTQREEANGTVGNTSVSYQTMVLEMEKQGDAWKVNNATWQK